MSSSEIKNETSFMNLIFQKIMNGEVLNKSKLSSYIFTSFIWVGIITHLFFSNIYSSHGNYGPASALVWGYTIILFSMFSLLFLQQISNSSVNLDLKQLKIDNIILMVLIIWLISLNSKNYKKINSNKVPNNFYSYSWYTTLLIMIELVIFITQITISNNNQDLSSMINKNIMQNINFVSYLLLVLIFMLIIIQQIILDNFSVDVL